MESSKRVDVGRRTVVRTAAWSAPAVAVISAAPAFAASGTPDLSTSVAGTPTRTFTDGFAHFTVPDTTTVFTNTGGGPVEGLVATISFTSGNVTDILIAGMPYGDLAPAVTVTGVGTNTVTLTISSDVLVIAPGDSFPLPLSLEFVTDNTGQATTMSVTGVAANGGTSTNFAPVDFAAAAPNLSTSSASAPARTVGTPPTISGSRVQPFVGDAYTFAPDAISVTNTGDGPAVGLAATISSTTGAIRSVELDGTVLGGPAARMAVAGASVSGLDTSKVEVWIPGATIDPGVTSGLPSLKIVTDNVGNATGIKVEIKATNAAPVVDLGATAFAMATGIAGPNLTTTSGGAFTYSNATLVKGGATTFRNTGNENAVGILTMIETTQTLSDIKSSGFSITNGITGINMLGTSFPSKRIHMQVPGGGLAAMTINAGGTKNSPAQEFYLSAPGLAASGDSITIVTTTFGLVSGQPKGIPLKSTVTVTRP